MKLDNRRDFLLRGHGRAVIRQTVKRVGESKVAYDIERGKVPLDNADGLAMLGPLGQSIEQHVSIFADDGFLLNESQVAKGVTELATLSDALR